MQNTQSSAVESSPLAVLVDRHTAPGLLFRAEEGKVRCLACAHRCLLAPGRRGICKVRFNNNGQLRVPHGYVAALHCDPVEKKPFFHVLPGSGALTFGMLGCDFHCSYCQNWVTSQALRDPTAGTAIRPISASQLVTMGRNQGAQLIVSSYNEPLITAEWAVSVFKAARPQGFLCAFVSNGNATPEVLEFLRPWTQAYKIDLKGFNENNYRALGGSLRAVTQSIQLAHQMGFWVEVVTLLIPGFNDSENELRALTKFLASVSPNIPWHVTAFHSDYHMTTTRGTMVDDLIRAAMIGQSAGLRFVYAGNLPGRVGAWENTFCPHCHALLVERAGFVVHKNQITSEGKCPECQAVIPGIWTQEVVTPNRTQSETNPAVSQHPLPLSTP
jgi:pyruvate formate lyase activating enzyme